MYVYGTYLRQYNVIAITKNRILYRNVPRKQNIFNDTQWWFEFVIWDYSSVYSLVVFTYIYIYIRVHTRYWSFLSFYHALLLDIDFTFLLNSVFCSPSVFCSGTHRNINTFIKYIPFLFVFLQLPGGIYKSVLKVHFSIISRLILKIKAVK